MATSDPKAAAQPSQAPAAKTSRPSPPAVEESADEEGVAEHPQVELVAIGGLVIQKTVYDDGDCETRVLSEPEIDPALVRSTRASQRARGH